MSKVILHGKNGVIRFDADTDFVAEGGTGRIFKGLFYPYVDGTSTDNNPTKSVAVKVLFDDMSNKYTIALTKRTSEINIEHPNIMQMVDFIEQDGIHHTISEWLTGQTLEDYLKENGRLESSFAIKVINAVSDGLKVLHENKPQIIHRDITPANIMICENGAIKIIDLGIAKIVDENRKSKTEIGAFLGNLYYTPPEQIDGFQSMVNPTSDIYSLGITLYEMLSGVTPFDQPDLKHKHFNSPIPDNEQISSQLLAVIRKATSKRQSERYNTIDEFKEDINQGKTPESETIISGLAPKERKKLRPIAVIIPILLIGLFAGGGYGGYIYYEQKQIEKIISENCDPIVETETITPIALDINDKKFVENAEKLLKEKLENNKNWEMWLNNPNTYNLQNEDYEILEYFTYDEYQIKNYPFLTKLLLSHPNIVEEKEAIQFVFTFMGDVPPSLIYEMQDELIVEKKDWLEEQRKIPLNIVDEVNDILENTKNYEKLGEFWRLIDRHTNAGWNYLLAGNIEKAEKSTMKGINDNENLAAKYNKALILMINNKHDNSYQDYNRILMNLDTTYNEKYYFNASIDDIRTFTRRKDIKFDKNYTHFILGLHYYYGSKYFPEMEKDYVREFRCFAYTADKEKFKDEIQFCNDKLPVEE